MEDTWQYIISGLAKLGCQLDTTKIRTEMDHRIPPNYEQLQREFDYRYQQRRRERVMLERGQIVYGEAGEESKEVVSYVLKMESDHIKNGKRELFKSKEPSALLEVNDKLSGGNASLIKVSDR